MRVNARKYFREREERVFMRRRGGGPRVRGCFDSFEKCAPRGGSDASEAFLSEIRARGGESSSVE